MSNTSKSEEDKAFHARALDAAIRISLLALLVLWCFSIVKPFILPVLWGAIMAVAIYPLFEKAHNKLGGSEKLTATLITLLALAALITPTVMLSGSMIDGSQELAENLEATTVNFFFKSPSPRIFIIFLGIIIGGIFFSTAASIL